MSQSKLLQSKRFAPFFVTQFLGAFNDNIFKNTLMLLITFSASDALGIDINVILNLAALLFILPFFLFSAIAGQLTDKYEKSGLIRRIKILEIVIMSFAVVGLIFEYYYFLLALLFLMGTQSTFFGPAKYAILPQHLESDELVGGNALVEMGTFVAILLGTIGAGVLMQFDNRTLLTATAVIVLAIIGYLASRRIPEAPSSLSDLKISYNPLATTIDLVKTVRKNRAIFLAIVAISWFWFLGAAYLTQFPNFSKEVLNGDSSLVTLLLALFTLGIGMGSMMCEKLSSSHVDLGIVPIGALGLTVFGLDLYFSIPAKPALTVAWDQFLTEFVHVRFLIDLFGIGFSGGIFIVPLYAFVQQRASESYRARTIAVINILNALFMVGSALAGIVFLGWMELEIPEFFAVLAVMNLVVCCYVFYQVDEFAIRFLVWMLSHTIYRVKHKNLEEIPEEGAAVLVCNHVSYVDALLIAGACPRPIRFVMDHNIFKFPVLGWFFRLVKAIPIAPQKVDSETYDTAFKAIDDALADGQLVCIFPEGKLTKTGEINPFRKGIEKIVETRAVTVLPLALIGLWGSVFSHKDGAALSKLPRRFWSRVTLVVGDSVPPNMVQAETLEDRVTQLVNNNQE